MKCVGFLTLEAWLIRRIWSSRVARQRALWYLRRVEQAELSWSYEDLANVSQGRTNVNIQSSPLEWPARKGGALPAIQGSIDHLLGLLTRFSAFPISPINKCNFVWHNFSPWNLVFKLEMNFENFFHQIFLNSYLCSHECHQSSSATFSEWLPKQCSGPMRGLK